MYPTEMSKDMGVVPDGKDPPNNKEGEANQVRSGNTSSDAEEKGDAAQSLSRRTNRPASTSEHFPPPTVPADPIARRRITAEETYLLKICRSLMMYGAPTHRLEEYMRMTAEVLGLPLQSFYMPGCMIISFNDTAWHSTEVHIVRCTQSLDLSKLYDVHAVYKEVIHQKVTVETATTRLDEITALSDRFPLWFRVFTYGLACACIGPVSYGARPIDLPITFLLGSILGFMDLILAAKSDLYAHIFEISATILTSFLARAFGSIPSPHPSTTPCFPAICQATLILILPGFTITNSALELQSKNIVSGSVRMVYGIIYTLFLAFGITIGTTIYGALDPTAPSSPQSCPTPTPGFWYQILFLPLFTLCYIIVNHGGRTLWPKSPSMILLTLIGWVVNHFSAQRFAANPPIAQALGALSVGVLANLYSRLGHEMAAAMLYPAIFVQVPGSLAAAGGLVSGVASADVLTHRNATETIGSGQGVSNAVVLNAGYAMVEIAIGITVGLSVSALVVYPFRKKKGKSGLFSF